MTTPSQLDPSKLRVAPLSLWEKCKRFRRRVWKVRGYISVSLITAIITNGDRVANWVKSDRPNLRTHADNLLLQPGEGGIVATFFMAIVNNGAPSGVHDWTLQASVPGKAPLYAPIGFYPPDRLRIERGTNTTDLSRDEWLPGKTRSPIPKDGLAFGYVMFLFKGISLEALNTTGTVFRISFRDARNKQISCDWKLDDKMSVSPWP